MQAPSHARHIGMQACRYAGTQVCASMRVAWRSAALCCVALRCVASRYVVLRCVALRACVRARMRVCVRAMQAHTCCMHVSEHTQARMRARAGGWVPRGVHFRLRHWSMLRFFSTSRSMPTASAEGARRCEGTRGVPPRPLGCCSPDRSSPTAFAVGMPRKVVENKSETTLVCARACGWAGGHVS